MSSQSQFIKTLKKVNLFYLGQEEESYFFENYGPFILLSLLN